MTLKGLVASTKRSRRRLPLPGPPLDLRQIGRDQSVGSAIYTLERRESIQTERQMPWKSPRAAPATSVSGDRPTSRIYGKKAAARRSRSRENRRGNVWC